MVLNHVANRLNGEYFDAVVEMFRTELGFFELRRTSNSIWIRQYGANVDLQFSRSESTTRDDDKRGSQISFICEAPRAQLEKLANWARERGLSAIVDGWSDREFYLDVPEAFVDFVIEAMTPDLADYEVMAGVERCESPRVL